MLLLPEISPVDGPLHQQNLQLLQAASAAVSAAGIQAALPSLFEAGDVVQMVASTPGNSKTFIIRNATRSQLVLLILGMDNFLQAPNILASWNDTSGPQQAFNVFASASALIVANLIFTPPGGYQGIRIIGHSFGGAVAENLQYAITPDMAPGGIFQAYTYGAPKPFNRNINQGNTAFQFRRCFRLDDSVPTLPLGSEFFGPLWLYIGVPTARAWEQWVQRETGLAFNAVAQLLPNVNPSASAAPSLVRLSLLAWLTSSDAFSNSGHSLNSYTQSCAVIAPASRPSTSPATRSISAPNITPTSTLVTRQAEQIAIVGAQADGARNDTAIGIASGIPLVPGVRYRGVTYLGKPWVFYGSTPVIPTKTRRTRRALVRYLNKHI